MFQREAMSNLIKFCKKCKITKTLGFFGKDSQKSDGLTSYCKECRLTYRKKNSKKLAEQAKEYRKLNKEKISVRRKKQYAENSDEIKVHQRESYHKRKITQSNHINLLKKQWKENNKDKYKKYWEKHYKKYRDVYIEKSIFRTKTVKKAKLIGFDTEIKEIYKNCPEGHHVDHIIPLKNPIVCGLHVPWNLQYLTAEENLKKSNKI